MDLTVAICVYNAARWLPRALQSVTAQTRSDFRLMIIDDCSTDGSANVVRRYFEAHQRQYELVQFDSNHGIAYGRSYAERHATTRYIMMLDADDILLPEAVERMYTAITADSRLMAVGCHLAYVDADDKPLGGGLFLGETSVEGFAKKASEGKLIFMQPTAVVDREASLRAGGYRAEGFDRGDGVRWADFCEDLDLWTRMSDQYADGRAIIVIPRVLAYYRKLGEGLSANTERMMVKMRFVKTNVRRRRADEPELSFAEFYDTLTPADLRRIHREAEAATAVRHAAAHLRRRHPLQAIGCVFRSLWYKPGYIFEKIRKNLIH